MNVTPRQVCKLGIHVFVVSGVAAAIVLTGWALKAVPHDRPQLVLMVYVSLIVAAATGGVTAAVAACQVATRRAFAAGLRYGSPHVYEEPAHPVLRLVE